MERGYEAATFNGQRFWDPWQADKSMRSIGPGIVVVFP
jgi:hypothetical protein